MRLPRISRRRVALLLLLLLPLLAGSVVVARELEETEARHALEQAIGEVVSAQRVAATTNDAATFVEQQDPSIPGWRAHQRRVFERDRPLNEYLGGVREVRLEGDLAYVTLGLSGHPERWVEGALYRRVAGRWYHTVPTASERGRALTRRTPGFVIRHRAWDAGRAPELEAALAAAKRRVEGALGPVGEVATVRVHASPMDMPQTPFHTGALFSGRDRSIHILSPYYWQRPEGEPTDWTLLAHEYTHFAADRLTGGGAPLWLDEGLAMLVAGEWDQRAQEALTDLIIAQDVPALRDLDRIFESSEPARAYITSVGLVDHLRRKLGPGALRRLLSRIGEGEDPDAALVAEAGLDSAALYREWLRTARARVYPK
jgi:hypothetical protein